MQWRSPDGFAARLPSALSLGANAHDNIRRVSNPAGWNALLSCVAVGRVTPGWSR
jgi:hypothetical protein